MPACHLGTRSQALGRGRSSGGSRVLNIDSASVQTRPGLRRGRGLQAALCVTGTHPAEKSLPSRLRAHVPIHGLAWPAGTQQHVVLVQSVF